MSIYHEYVEYISNHEDMVGLPPAFLEMTQDEIDEMCIDAPVWIKSVNGSWVFLDIPIRIVEEKV